MKIPKELKWQPSGKTLGQGGQATIVEVLNSSNDDDTKYALKAIYQNKPKKAYERFYKEIGSIKKLNHPSIIKIIDNSEPGDEFQYYVMELVPNSVSLKKLLGTDKNLFYKNVLKSFNFFVEMLNVINACYEAKVIHRDLSPSNILITPEFKIKVIDFGICQIENSEAITLIDEGVGTQNYMAPECESGIEADISSSSDIYSAGKILWSAVTNLNAFARESMVFSNKSMNKIFPDNPEIWHLNHIFKKTIRYNAKDRWQSAYDALLDCQKIFNLIKSHYPPLELIQYKCPICGFGDLVPFEDGYMIFGNPKPTHFQYNICNYCGYTFAINLDTYRSSINKFKDLE